MRASPPKYRQIAEELERRLAAGEFPAGETLPGEKRLAGELGVNHLTVRRALQLLTERDLVHTIPSKGTYPGPSSGHGGDSKSEQGLVGILFSDADPYFLRILSELESQMAARGLSPVVRLSRGSPAREVEIMRGFQRLGVLGVLAAPLSGSVLAYRQPSMPVVFFDSRLEELPIPYVVTDDFQGTRWAVEHLLGMGHRRIAHIGGGGEATSKERLRGFDTALSSAGIRVPAEFRQRREYSREWGHLAAERLFALPLTPTALVCGSDVIAAGALRYLVENGRRCPEDVSLIGYSDSELSRDLQLTTVRQPMERVAATAWRLLAALFEGHHTPLENRLETSLVVRRTTAPPPL
jgi:LacI family transcriptional regulator